MANLQLSRNLSKYRIAYGYTQKQLSQTLNISRQAYSNYETGKRDPDLDLLIRLSEIYQISLDQLVHQTFVSPDIPTRERKRPYTTAVEPESEDTLYLTREEVTFLMRLRESDEEKHYIVSQILK